MMNSSLDYYDSSTATQQSITHPTDASDDDVTGWWPDTAPWFRVLLIILYGTVFIGCIVGKWITALLD